MRNPLFLSALVAASTLVAACADEIPPARSADSPISTSAPEAKVLTAPSLSGRAATYDPAAAGPATAGHAHHHGGDGMEGMPMPTAAPSASASAAPPPASTTDHSAHTKGAPAGGPK